MASDGPVVLSVDPQQPEPAAIRRAAGLILAGELVAIPTETVYGLGANALDPEAVRRVYSAKGRPAGNPLIVHVADAGAAEAMAGPWPEPARRLAAVFWPGPLTLVLPLRDPRVTAAVAGGATVAVRVPSHPVMQALIRDAGVPIAAPSANRSEHVSPTRAEHVIADLGTAVSLVLDAGATECGLESVVVLPGEDAITILRRGPIAESKLREVAGVDSRPHGPHAGDPLLSPGMLPRHYAPDVPLEIVDPDAIAGRVAELSAAGTAVGAVVRTVRDVRGASIAWLPIDAPGYAARLYAALRELEGRGVERIVAESLPHTEAWAAVRDRLERASGMGAP